MFKLIQHVIKFTTENLMLMAILLCVTICILVKSYFYGFYISPDSAHYLRAAREILRGHGFYVYPGWFGVWPVGYPFLISLVSFITHTEIYLASKILTIIIVWIIGLTLYKRFGRTAWGYALVMFNIGFLRIFIYTWSEIPFIMGLVLVSFWVSDVITENIVKASLYIKLTFGILLLFLSRYIGAFGIGVIGLLWIYNVYLAFRYKNKTARKRVAYLTVSGMVSGIFILIYLLVNRKMTGYMTGLARFPVDNVKELLLNLGQEQLNEMHNVFSVFFSIGSIKLPLLLWFIFIAFVLYSVIRNIKDIKLCDKNIITPLVFIAMGVIYWLAIVSMRFTARFDPFSWRLLFPSSILLFIGFMGLLARNEKIKTFLVRFGGFTHTYGGLKSASNTVKILTIIFFSLLILIIKSIFPQMISGSSGYREMKEFMLSTYAPIPDGALVLWGEDNMYLLHFLRDKSPTGFNVNPDSDDIKNLFEKFDNFNEVYIYIPGLRERMDDELGRNNEIHTYFEQYRDSQEMFVRIK